MTFLNKAIIKLALIIAINSLFTSCDYDTKEILDTTNTTFPNGKRMVVEKNTKLTTSTGIFTNYNYGTTHSFTYTFSIKPENSTWDGKSGEPKNIIFCNDTTYVRYLKEKTIKIEHTDSLSSTSYTTEIHEAFEKHIDKRYFFQLLGEQYWTTISAKEYGIAKQHCEEYGIPNDTELSLAPIVKDTLQN